LKNLFDHVSNCIAYHEPSPIGNGKAMRLYSKGHSEAIEEISRLKINKIRYIMQNNNYHTYVETNHCFIKGFGFFISNYISEEKIGVIIIKRDQTKIAKSLLRISCSPLTPDGRKWIITPTLKEPQIAPPAVLIFPKITFYIAYFLKFIFRCARFVIRKLFKKELQTPTFLSKYELDCLNWYLEETTERGKNFKKKFPNMKVL